MVDPNPVLYQGKWKMLPITCEHFYYKVNRIYKLFENEENNLQLLEVFFILLWFCINLSPRNSFSSKKNPIHSIRANCFLQASSANTTAVRGQKNCFKVRSHKWVTLCYYMVLSSCSVFGHLTSYICWFLVIQQEKELNEYFESDLLFSDKGEHRARFSQIYMGICTLTLVCIHSCFMFHKFKYCRL